MRITKIEIKNFRAFYGRPYQINLHRAGKNLLIYGENGSGKSSLYLALECFLESSEDDSYQFENYQNIFIADAGYIKLHLRADRRSNEQIYEWSDSVKETNDPLFIEASKAKGFLDYKALLETHYVHRESGIVNVFDLLVKNLLANTVSALTGRSLADDWEDIQPPFPRRNATNQIAILEEQIETFNFELADRLTELQTKASEILEKFGYDVKIEFDFQGITYNRDKKRLPVRYSEDPKKLISEDFWTAIKSGSFLQSSLINKLELYRKFILNQLSHATIINIIKKEISEAIDAVENLEQELKKL